MIKIFILSQQNHFLINNNYFLKPLKPLKDYYEKLKELLKKHLKLFAFTSNNLFYISNKKEELNIKNSEMDMCAQNIIKLIYMFNAGNNTLKSILYHKLIKSTFPRNTNLNYNIPINILLNINLINNISYLYNNSIKKIKNKLNKKLIISYNKLGFYFNKITKTQFNNNKINYMQPIDLAIIHSTNLNNFSNINYNNIDIMPQDNNITNLTH